MGAERGQLTFVCSLEDPTGEAPGSDWGSVCRSTPFLILACDDSDLLLAVLAWIDPDSRWSDAHPAGLSKPLGVPVLRIAVGGMLDLALRRP